MTDNDSNTNHPGSPTIDGPRLSVRSDRRLIRAGGRSERFLLVEVVAPTVAGDPERRRPPVNLSFVLDRSGSMGGQDKLGLAKRAVDEALARLEPHDRFSVVAYDDRVETVVDGSPASPEARRLAADRLRQIDARGSTDLAGGWLTGCEQVAAGLDERGVNRALLLTDGLANIGLTDPAELERNAADLRTRGVTTSTFGVGTDFDERLLQAMADAGGGHFYFIGDAAQIRDHITSEVGETLEVSARDVVLELTAPESVRIETLTPFRLEQRGSRTLVHLGDMVSGQSISVVLRLTFDLGVVGQEIGALLRVTDREAAFERAQPALAPVALAWAYADHVANDAQSRDRDVDRIVARQFVARARQEAVRLNREGRFADAAAAIDGVRRRIAGYAGSDAELLSITAELHEERPAYAAAMPEMLRKQRWVASANVAHSRTAEGRSRRAGS